MIKTFCLLAIIALVAIQCQFTGALNYTICEADKSLAEVKSVVVNDCETLQDACPFVRGFNKTIEMEIVPKQNINQAKVKVAGKLSAIPVPFHVNPDEACGNYGFNCPLEAGKQYKFKLSLPILRSYPKINVGVFFRLINEKGETISCIELPARIQEPQKL